MLQSQRHDDVGENLAVNLTWKVCIICTHGRNTLLVFFHEISCKKKWSHLSLKETCEPCLKLEPECDINTRYSWKGSQRIFHIVEYKQKYNFLQLLFKFFRFLIEKVEGPLKYLELLERNYVPGLVYDNISNCK